MKSIKQFKARYRALNRPGYTINRPPVREAIFVGGRDRLHLREFPPIVFVAGVFVTDDDEVIEYLAQHHDAGREFELVPEQELINQFVEETRSQKVTQHDMAEQMEMMRRNYEELKRLIPGASQMQEVKPGSSEDGVIMGIAPEPQVTEEVVETKACNQKSTAKTKHGKE